MPMLDETVRVHAVRERTVAAREIDYAVEELRLRGFTVLRSGLADSLIDDLRVSLDELYSVQCARFGGEARLQAMKDANVVRAPCAEDGRFIEVAMDPVLHEISELMLGPYFILMSQNGILNVPGTDHDQFAWHRDLNYQHWTSSRCLALSAVLCIDPFDAVTGGTYVLPASHKMEAFPSDRYVRANQFVVHAAPGDWVLFDSMLFHRTGRNSSDRVRRAVNHIVVPPFIRQQFSFPNMLGARLHSEAQARFFGVGMETSSDATAWRFEKLSKVPPP